MSKNECKSLYELLKEIRGKDIYVQKKVNLNHENLLLWAKVELVPCHTLESSKGMFWTVNSDLTVGVCWCVRWWTLKEMDVSPYSLLSRCPYCSTFLLGSS